MTRTIAVMSIVTGIAPNELLDTDPDIFAEMVELVNKRHEK